MVFRTWVCIVAMVSWSALGVACAESSPGTEIETVAQGLTAAGPLSAIQLCGLIKGGACPQGTYCRHHDGACEDTSIGWCAPVSEMCTMQYDPVCGCDGQTYGNECSMMGAAVSMAHDGTCDPGCNWDAECLDGQTCDVQGCGEDAGGTCVKATIACNRMWAPVCGCDGETYSNDCHRVNAGVGLDHKGACASPCGGIAGFQCEGKDDVCYYPEGTCQIVDNMGVCEEPPKICPKTTDPVCGCDGTSYRNACMMKRQGVSMDHPGLCCTPILCLVGEPVDTDGDGCADFCPPAQGCEGPNPAGCKNTGCDDGETCVFGIDCTASICFCDSVLNVWNCTKDCGGGTCVPDQAPCCDPKNEPGTNGVSACFEGASCCSDGQWHCNDPSTASVCEAPGLVCETSNLCDDYEPPGCEQSGCSDGYICGPSVGCVPSSCSCNPDTGVVMCTADCGGGTCVPDEPSVGCCDPTLEPGTGDNPTCFEGSSCCADGAWQCNGAMGQPVCEVVGSVCEGSCCDPTKEPGVGDNDLCFEGSSCCSDGTWQCNDGGAGSVCEAPGWVCQNLCGGFTQPGCVQSGCDDGYVCDTTVGCVSSSCSCDPSDGSVICTDDCGGGTCVPEDSNAACEEPNPQACKAGDCAAGTTCDFSFGCAPSTCNCWADADGVGHWNCTKDCQPGVCVPDDLGAGCCIDDAHCEVGQLCVNGGPNSVGVCKQLPPPASPAISCWSDQGCPEDETCDGGSVCPCDAVCIVADSWGLCTGGDDGPGVPDQPEEEQ